MPAGLGLLVEPPSLGAVVLRFVDGLVAELVGITGGPACHQYRLGLVAAWDTPSWTCNWSGLGCAVASTDHMVSTVELVERTGIKGVGKLGS